jgi:hypothetical protein
MEYDHTQTREFLDWINSHPTGFVAAFRYGDHMKLHRANCPSLRKPTDQKRDAKKFCCEKRDAVEAWAAKQGQPLSPCRLAGCFRGH